MPLPYWNVQQSQTVDRLGNERKPILLSHGHIDLSWRNPGRGHPGRFFSNSYRSSVQLSKDWSSQYALISTPKSLTQASLFSCLSSIEQIRRKAFPPKPRILHVVYLHDTVWRQLSVHRYCNRCRTQIRRTSEGQRREVPPGTWAFTARVPESSRYQEPGFKGWTSDKKVVENT